MFIIPKILQIVYKIIYITFDSIIHPKKGKERLSNAWHHIKTDAKRYWEGFKLLAADVRQSSKILAKLAKGGTLTFREKRQLRRTTLDMLRFVPFAFFIIIPAMEILLPFYIWLFPNMLPTRFATETQKQQTRRKQLELRLNLASFLEDTLQKYAKDVRNREELSKENEESLQIIIQKMKNKEDVNNDQILKVAKLFSDSITLDNATTTELANLCSYMGLNAFGPNALLRMRLANRVKEIKSEDKGIRKEGVDNLPPALLKQLIRERGMRADFGEWILRRNLKKWLELSLDNEVPITLLIASRIFSLQHTPDVDESSLLKDTITSMSEESIDEMYVERAGIVDALKEKKIIEKQAKLIAEEQELLLEQELKESNIDDINKDEKQSVIVTPIIKDDVISEEKEKQKIANLVDTLQVLIGESDKDYKYDSEKKKLLKIQNRLNKILSEDNADRSMSEIDAISDELKGVQFGPLIDPIITESPEKLTELQTQTFGIDEEKELQKLKDDKIKEKLTKKIESMIDETIKTLSTDDEKELTNIKITVNDMKNKLKEKLHKNKHINDEYIDKFVDELHLEDIELYYGVVDTDDLIKKLEIFVQEKKLHDEHDDDDDISDNQSDGDKEELDEEEKEHKLKFEEDIIVDKNKKENENEMK